MLKELMKDLGIESAAEFWELAEKNEDPEKQILIDEIKELLELEI